MKYRQTEKEGETLSVCQHFVFEHNLRQNNRMTLLRSLWLRSPRFRGHCQRFRQHWRFIFISKRFRAKWFHSFGILTAMNNSASSFYYSYIQLQKKSQGQIHGNKDNMHWNAFIFWIYIYCSVKSIQHISVVVVCDGVLKICSSSLRSRLDSTKDEDKNMLFIFWGSQLWRNTNTCHQQSSHTHTHTQ